jgi:hypothetical protein
MSSAPVSWSASSDTLAPVVDVAADVAGLAPLAAGAGVAGSSAVLPSYDSSLPDTELTPLPADCSATGASLPDPVRRLTADACDATPSTTSTHPSMRDDDDSETVLVTHRRCVSVGA